MSLDVASTSLAGPARAWRALSPQWRGGIIRLGAAWLVLLFAFLGDWGAMARQWWDISTYNHVLLIPAILGWLVWQRWPQLERLTPTAWWPGLILLAGAAFLWLLGAMSGLDLARQAGVVAMLGACVPLILGVRVTAALIFPLGYLVFLVPIGEELVNVLQTITAEITIALTHLSGIPARIDGVFIDTPAGLFEVAEACSGVKFLIAMVAFGVLAANVCFLSWRRRTVMLLACVAVPILANGIRAWGTIYAAQIFGIEAAAGFDHIVYGWFFFAIVLALVIACAWRFFDRPLDGPAIDLAAIENAGWLAGLERFAISGTVAVIGFALVLIAARCWALAADTLAAPVPARIDLPAVEGWARVDYTPTIWWEPRAQGADHRLLGRYRDGRGHQVDVFVALYASQGEGREAGGFGQGALVPASAWAWQSPAPSVEAGKGERLLGNGRIERIAVTWYRQGELLSGSNARLKLAVIVDHLLFRAEPTTMLILSAEDTPRGRAEQSITAFRASTGSLARWMDGIAQVR
ncbi:exosortase A [Novosphingobium resinovorum]|uniref:exosortase A n=1 Tax=Sphingomonadaceae TaxID=41297 RepID=UPI00027C979B|nr:MULTISPECIES: exosortase A [Sphingomonadaceae]EJU11781.1 ABC transporter [Sphingomonas sp. LH128]MBF7011608.1 exosortase A [Novosphingobium sp. HR1a]WJM26367.1 exosortase A [Novosphingobium resinovorum]